MCYGGNNPKLTFLSKITYLYHRDAVFVGKERDTFCSCWTSFICPLSNTMITRRRGNCNSALKSLEVEVSSAVKTIEDVPSLPEEFQVDDFDSTGMELDEFLGIEDLEWTGEWRESTSPIFDIELGDLYSDKNRDSGVEVAAASSPERTSSALKIRNKQRQASQVINKNAIAARLNRLKKKEYVNSLEKKLGIMSTENNTLKTENCQLTKRVEELEDETRAPIQTSTTTHCHGNV
ncbi:uncharacterized protein crebzf [Festucalex cinctus]